MMGCGHQLGCADNSGWLLNSSATAPVGGSSSTNQILHRIMADELYDAEPPHSRTRASCATYSEFLQSKRINLATAKDRECKFLQHRESRIRRSKIESFHDFSEFDEAEHHDGCPVKWLFRRQSTESWRSGGSRERVDEGEKESRKRDKIPREIQISKIGLKRRFKRSKNTEKAQEENKESSSCGSIGQQLNRLAVYEHRRPELESKVNFRPFDSEDESDDSGEICRLQNFLHPRPLTGQGQRQWLYVFLAPRIDTPVASDIMSTPTARTEVIHNNSPCVSVRSIIFPEISRPFTTKVSAAPKKWVRRKKKPTSYRQLALLDITLREQTKKRSANANVAEKEKTEAKQVQECSSWMDEDRLYGLKRFIGNEEVVVIHEQAPRQKGQDDKVVLNKPRKSRQKSKTSEALFLVSSKVQFFERPGKPTR